MSTHLQYQCVCRFGGTVVAVKLKTGPEKVIFCYWYTVHFFTYFLEVNVGALSGKMVKEGVVSTNWGAIMEDWSILGEGLVREIQVVNTDAMV